MSYRLLSIDPGATFGWAAWLHDAMPSETNTFTPSGDTWQKRIQSAYVCFRGLLTGLKPKVVACEQPFFGDGGTSYGVAGSGSLVKLTLMVGGLWSLCCERQIKFVLIEVRDWRGGLKDKHVQQRLRSVLPEGVEYGSGHEWDAVGIGRYYFTGTRLQ